MLVQIKQQLDYKTQYTSQFRTRKGMQYIFAIMPKILSKLQLLGQKPFIEAQSETKLSEEQEKEIKYQENNLYVCIKCVQQLMNDGEQSLREVISMSQALLTL